MLLTVAVFGTLDTKGREVQFACEILRRAGCRPYVIDIGVLGEPLLKANVPREEVAKAGGTTIAELATGRDRTQAAIAMARGAAALVQKACRQGRVDAALGLGGQAGTAICSAAMRCLPVGLPKMIVSTVASGNTRQYVGTRDITMMYSIVDMSGINKLSRRILANAANAVAGMAMFRREYHDIDKPLVGVTMFAVTSPCVEQTREVIEAAGYEMLVFRTVDAGSASMEDLVREGYIAGVLDVTTTELADDLAGGVFTAGPGRLLAPGKKGIPHVIVPGGLDMVKFGPMDSIPQEYSERTLDVYKPSVTLMRTNADECRKLGEELAEKANKAKGPVAVVLPLGGLSAMDKLGQPFHDPEADKALFDAIEGTLAHNVRFEKLDLHINDPEFSRFIAELFVELAGL